MKTGIFEFPERKIVRELNMSNNCIDVISIISAFWVMLAHYSNYLFDTSDWLVRIPSPYFAVVFSFLSVDFYVMDQCKEVCLAILFCVKESLGYTNH